MNNDIKRLEGELETAENELHQRRIEAEKLVAPAVQHVAELRRKLGLGGE